MDYTTGHTCVSSITWHAVMAFTLKILGACSMIMIVVAFICCLVQGTHNHTFYLLACNLVISCVVGFVNAYWYKAGDLGGDKSWYMLLLCGVILFQCLTTDIFVFNVRPPDFNTTMAA